MTRPTVANMKATNSGVAVRAIEYADASRTLLVLPVSMAVRRLQPCTGRFEALHCQEFGDFALCWCCASQGVGALFLLPPMLDRSASARTCQAACSGNRRFTQLPRLMLHSWAMTGAAGPVPR